MPAIRLYTRLRFTPVLGYLRVQAEACGPLRLFVEEPDRAEGWVRASLSEGGGRRFYGQTQAALRTIMTRYGLNPFYERGSGSSQHVRMTSARRDDFGRQWASLWRLLEERYPQDLQEGVGGEQAP